MDYGLILDYLDIQNNQVVTHFDITDRSIAYSNIVQHREIRTITGDEEVVRALLLTKLVRELGYSPDKIEIEKSYKLGRPNVNRPRIDVIVRDTEGNAFLYIELKSPQEIENNKDEVIENQLFNLASQERGQGHDVKYLVLYTFELTENEIKDNCMLIDYQKFTTFNAWNNLRNFADELPARYGLAQKEPFIKNGTKDLETRFTHEQLDGLRRNLHNVLWGGGGTDDNDIFSSLVNIILAKIQDELEKQDGEKYDFQIFSFKNGEEFESNELLYTRINNLYRRALRQRLNINDTNILNESFVIDRNRFTLAKLKYTVSELEKYSFTLGNSSSNGKDILGEFFENIVSNGFKQSRGQFFTHLNIVKFILWGLQLDKLAINKVNKNLEIPYLIDTSAGSGSFLIEYMKFITKVIKYRFRDQIFNAKDQQLFLQRNFYPDELENIWAEKYIYGCEINPNLGTAIKVNMILHGDGSANIFVGSNKGDGLLKFSDYEKKLSQEQEPQLYKKKVNDKKVNDIKVYDKKVNESFDVIITNPPFSVSFDNDTRRSLNDLFIFGSRNNSENLFVERWYQLLKPNGRLGVVLPESVFDTTENKYIRLFIYKYFKVKAVVSLPQLTFKPFTSTKTSLLFAQKKTNDEVLEWIIHWSKYSEEWKRLKKSCEDLKQVYLDGQDRNRYPTIRDLTEVDEKITLFRMLKDYIEEDDQQLQVKEIIEKYKDELKELCKHDNDTTDVFGSVNTWWVFGEVAKELNYNIFMAEVENIGYKRTTRGERTMPNELFRVDANGEILVDDTIMETVLDHLRTIEWH